ncbi:MAG: hypothetical protein N3A38_17030 [Planctomycetota bacterium]|nr:hypothetical protein [Planctomycetota bacterium]
MALIHHIFKKQIYEYVVPMKCAVCPMLNDYFFVISCSRFKSAEGNMVGLDWSDIPSDTIKKLFEEEKALPTHGSAYHDFLCGPAEIRFAGEYKI